jgi:hypothetical protein
MKHRRCNVHEWLNNNERAFTLADCPCRHDHSKCYLDLSSLSMLTVLRSTRLSCDLLGLRLPSLQVATHVLTCSTVSVSNFLSKQQSVVLLTASTHVRNRNCISVTRIEANGGDSEELSAPLAW